jgi:hypothetical protein
MSRTARIFWIGLLGIAALAFGLRISISTNTWFLSDDFYFLHLIQKPGWSWSEVFVPTRVRFVAGYRPLGLDGYFYWNFSLFGFNALGYYASAMAIQCATAAVVFRIVRQFELDPRCASLAALLTACAGPSLTASYAVNEHNYLCAALCYALTITWFLDYLTLRRPRALALSSVALLVGLLSNEVCATATVLLFGIAFAREMRAAAGLGVRDACIASGKRALAVTWPHFMVAALFVDFLIDGVPRAAALNWFYEVDFGLDTLSNTLGNLRNVFGGQLRLFAIVALTLILSWRARRRFGEPGWFAVSWLIVGLLPFAVLAFPATRFALLQLPAAALCVACLADALIRSIRGEQRQNAALLALACLCIPWEGTINVMKAPPGRLEHQAYLLASQVLPRNESECVQVLCGAEGLASSAECARFRDHTFSGALFRAVVPARPLHVEFEDARLNMGAYYQQPMHDCVRFELRSDQRLVLLTNSAEPHAALSHVE